MGVSSFDGPLYVPGSMGAIPSSLTGSPVPDPNQDAGPSLFYQGIGILDPRLVYMKDKVQGYTGVVQAFQDMTQLRSVSAVPAALSVSNIASVAGVVSGVAMVFANASLGIARNIPVRPFANTLMGVAPVVAPVVLDFGFGFVNATLGSRTVIVSDSRLFTPGMPLVIATLGNGAGTAPLVTQVSSILTATTISLADPALFTNAAAPVGTGDIWGPSPMGFPAPQAAYPFMAGGPGLFLDPRQAIARGISITSGATSTGGNVAVVGLDIYGQTIHETLAVPAVGVVYSKKIYKAIISLTPAFTDAHTYTVGTSDVFGFHFRAPFWEETTVIWNGVVMTATAGFLAPDQTEPATALTGDVRGVIQVSASGAGTPITGPAASNGTVSSLVMTGRKLEMRQIINVGAMIRSTPAEPKYMFGVTQF